MPLRSYVPGRTVAGFIPENMLLECGLGEPRLTARKHQTTPKTGAATQRWPAALLAVVPAAAGGPDGDAQSDEEEPGPDFECLTHIVPPRVRAAAARRDDAASDPL